MCYDVHVSVPFANVHSCVLAVLVQIQCPPRHHHTVNLATLPGSRGVFVVITRGRFAGTVWLCLGTPLLKQSIEVFDPGRSSAITPTHLITRVGILRSVLHMYAAVYSHPIGSIDCLDCPRQLI